MPSRKYFFLFFYIVSRKAVKGKIRGSQSKTRNKTVYDYGL